MERHEEFLRETMRSQIFTYLKQMKNPDYDKITVSNVSLGSNLPEMADQFRIENIPTQIPESCLE